MAKIPVHVTVRAAGAKYAEVLIDAHFLGRFPRRDALSFAKTDRFSFMATDGKTYEVKVLTVDREIAFGTEGKAKIDGIFLTCMLRGVLDKDDEE
ncbi:hypothetical protein HOU03_gp076 [Caulobacter phage CcrSC]|uniref:Uncharacterized protein n=1 Tax=Caulobacter phage CcrSC TaxID=2283272 RepID=A0A385EFT8_9CAUD|nr:hypothetical protein HOU03_gp076 [Caulobacter phage CcrSC]AXQ69658.1 hypothetical protein CcrSC_gp076c [Caulobacter phage CcrSC]